MKDQEHYAGRFSAEVDRILEQHGRAEEEGPSPEYPELLALAEQLATLDFSQGRPLQPRLRVRLLNQLDATISARQRPRWWRRLFLPRRRRALGALALMALVMLVWISPTGQAVAQSVEQFIRELHWPHTTVRQFPPSQNPTATAVYQGQLEDQTPVSQDCRFSFEGSDFEFYYPADVAVRNQVVPLSQAIAEAGFDLRVPTFLPDGFVLSEIRLLCVAPYDVFMIYEGPEGRLGLYQSFVSVTSREQVDGNTAVTEKRDIGVFTNKTLEDARVGTARAVLINKEALVWEADDISFNLIAPGLDGETLVRIAESLAPAREVGIGDWGLGIGD